MTTKKSVKWDESIDPEVIGRRNKAEEVEENPYDKKTTPDVNAGPLGTIVDLVGNPSHDKIREVTAINVLQGRLLPQLDVANAEWGYLIEVALYRKDPAEYLRAYKRPFPIPPNLIDEFTHRTAQWQKSVNAMGLKGFMDLALAETETRANDTDTGMGFGDFND